VSDITRLLGRWSEGDGEAFRSLMPLVYEELRRLADSHLRRERAEHTLQPTALVHEAYLRLSGLTEMRLENRAHFFGAAAEVMRRVLVDHARRRNAGKRGGGVRPEAELDVAVETPIDLRLDLLALDRALDELAAVAPEKARVVELRYFGGLSVEETGEFLSVSPATVKRHWQFARAWLYRRVSGAPPPGEPGALKPAPRTPER
jgi:RNA polymerase sigma factor (TIGR02999 family)